MAAYKYAAGCLPVSAYTRLISNRGVACAPLPCRPKYATTRKRLWESTSPHTPLPPSRRVASPLALGWRCHRWGSTRVQGVGGGSKVRPMRPTPRRRVPHPHEATRPGAPRPRGTRCPRGCGRWRRLRRPSRSLCCRPRWYDAWSPAPSRSLRPAPTSRHRPSAALPAPQPSCLPLHREAGGGGRRRGLRLPETAPSLLCRAGGGWRRPLRHRPHFRTALFAPDTTPTADRWARRSCRAAARHGRRGGDAPAATRRRPRTPPSGRPRLRRLTLPSAPRTAAGGACGSWRPKTPSEGPPHFQSAHEQGLWLPPPSPSLPPTARALTPATTAPALESAWAPPTGRRPRVSCPGHSSAQRGASNDYVTGTAAAVRGCEAGGDGRPGHDQRAEARTRTVRGGGQRRRLPEVRIVGFGPRRVVGAAAAGRLAPVRHYRFSA